MSLRPNAKPWIVPEQIIEDVELTFQFEVMPDGSPRLRIFGEVLAFGNREIIFDRHGNHDGGGTYTGGLCKPTWPGPLE